MAAESQNKVPAGKKSSIEIPKDSIQTHHMIRDRKSQGSASLTPRGGNQMSNASSRVNKLSLNLSVNSNEQPQSQTSLTPNHSSGSSLLFSQQSESTEDTDQQIQANGMRPAPVLSAPERERQIKYLGLVIEKDEEHDIEEDDEDMFRKFKSLRAELAAFENGTMNTDEQPYIQR